MRNGRTVISKLGELGVPVSELTPLLEGWILVGAEGEGEEEGGSGGSNKENGGSGGEGSNGGSGSGSGGDGKGNGGDTGGDSGGDSGSEGDTFDRAYVEKLRREAADYRTRAKAAEEELDEKKKAEMSDLEKAQTTAQQEKERGDKLQSEIDTLRLHMAVTSVANSMNFHDPEDALSLIDSSSIQRNDEGLPNKQSVEAAVKRLAESKPHLVKGKNAGSGSGDGGARGQGGGNMTEEEKRKQLQQEYAERGGVPIPKL